MHPNNLFKTKRTRLFLKQELNDFRLTSLCTLYLKLLHKESHMCCCYQSQACHAMVCCADGIEQASNWSCNSHSKLHLAYYSKK
jgi:hypothetical protein